MARHARDVWEFFGSVASVLKATLTELEAAGLPAQAAQALGTGRSVELAHDELAKAEGIGISVVTLDDPAYPARLRQIYDPPPVLYIRSNVAAISQPGIAVVARVILPHMEWGWRSDWDATLPREGLSLSADWHVAWTRSRIAGDLG